jgi:hypothetical protein
VGGDVPVAPDGVLRLEQHVALLVDEQRSEGVVALLAGPAGQLDGAQQVRIVDADQVSSRMAQSV